MKKSRAKIFILTSLNQKGQGAIEYILLLLIMVSVIVGLIFQLNQSFKTYAENYFGEYLQCLLRAGELPNLGANDEQAATASLCQEQFAEFTFSSGRPPVSNNRSNPNNARAGNSQGTGATTTGRKFRANENSTTNGRGGRSSTAGRTGATSRSNQSGQKFPVNLSATKNKANKDQVTSTSGSFFGTNAYRQSSKKDRDIKTQRIVGKYGEYGFQEKKVKGNPKKAKVRGIVNGEEDGKKSSFRANASVKNATTTEDKPLSFGDYFRYIIIAVILIILLLILGGQALQISKGSEE